MFIDITSKEVQGEQRAEWPAEIAVGEAEQGIDCIYRVFGLWGRNIYCRAVGLDLVFPNIGYPLTLSSPSVRGEESWRGRPGIEKKAAQMRAG